MDLSENWSLVLVENARHSIYLTDREGTIQYVNPAFEEMTGYSREDVLGKNPSILQSGQHSDEFYEELWSTILDGDVWHSEIINQRKNGEIYHADQTISPITDESGCIKGFVAINVDITERKEKRNFIEQIYDRLDDEHKRISRELHDQLGHKLLYSLMQMRILKKNDDGPNPPQKIQEVIDILEDSINQVRELTSVIRPLSLDAQTLSDALESHASKVSEQHGVNVQLETVGVPDPEGVSSKLKQALYRIAQEGVLNAIEHGNADQITLLLSGAGDRLSLLLEDNGTGFEVEELSQAPLEEKIGIVGMRERVQLLGGSFDLESSPGHGTQVKVEVPLQASGSDSPSLTKEAKIHQATGNT